MARALITGITGQDGVCTWQNFSGPKRADHVSGWCAVSQTQRYRR